MNSLEIGVSFCTSETEKEGWGVDLKKEGVTTVN